MTERFLHNGRPVLVEGRKGLVVDASEYYYVTGPTCDVQFDDGEFRQGVPIDDIVDETVAASRSGHLRDRGWRGDSGDAVGLVFVVADVLSDRAAGGSPVRPYREREETGSARYPEVGRDDVIDALYLITKARERLDAAERMLIEEAKFTHDLTWEHIGRILGNATATSRQFAQRRFKRAGGPYLAPIRARAAEKASTKEGTP